MFPHHPLLPPAIPPSAISGGGNGGHEAERRNRIRQQPDRGAIRVLRRGLCLEKEGGGGGALHDLAVRAAIHLSPSPSPICMPEAQPALLPAPQLHLGLLQGDQGRQAREAGDDGPGQRALAADPGKFHSPYFSTHPPRPPRVSMATRLLLLREGGREREGGSEGEREKGMWCNKRWNAAGGWGNRKKPRG